MFLFSLLKLSAAYVYILTASSPYTAAGPEIGAIIQILIVLGSCDVVLSVFVLHPAKLKTIIPAVIIESVFFMEDK